MLIFGVNEAQYFCLNYNGGYGNPTNSMRDYCISSLKNLQILSEGTKAFEEYRSHLLRFVERNLFLSASNYNLSHRLMVSGYSSWTHISLYYGAFFSAKALLGMFGVYYDLFRIAIGVLTGNEGSQKLVVTKGDPVKRKGNPVRSLSTYQGTHQAFWDIYYNTILPLHAYVAEPDLQFALSPISGDPAWQITQRNEINYNSYEALSMIIDFDASFNKKHFPVSLPGVLNTQFRLTEALTLLAFRYAKMFGIKTDAFSHLPGRKERIYKLKRYIFKPSRGIPVQSGKLKIIMS